jgi:hypothetical protein
LPVDFGALGLERERGQAQMAADIGCKSNYLECCDIPEFEILGAQNVLGNFINIRDISIRIRK